MPSESDKRRADVANAGNWFGESIKGNGVSNSGSSVGTGVGKYWKRSRETSTTEPAITDEPSKKRKTGWGDFAGW
jgi:peptidyl-prolyl cis-trans isomerase-like protein 2